MVKKVRSSKRFDERHSKLTKGEKKTALKVGKRYWDMCRVFEKMSIEELDEIKDVERSKTDNHAYNESYEKVKAATVSVDSLPDSPTPVSEQAAE